MSQYLKIIVLFLLFVCCSYTFACSKEFDGSQTKVSDRVSKENAQKQEVLQEDTDMGMYGHYPKGTPLKSLVKIWIGLI